MHRDTSAFLIGRLFAPSVGDTLPLAVFIIGVNRIIITNEGGENSRFFKNTLPCINVSSGGLERGAKEWLLLGAREDGRLWLEG